RRRRPRDRRRPLLSRRAPRARGADSRRRRRRPGGDVRFLALVVLLAGCFSPQIDDGQFACADNQCPSGFTCAMCDLRCWRDPDHQCRVEPPDGAVPVTVDAPPPPPVDAAVPDVPIMEPDAPSPPDAPIATLDAPLPPDGAVEIDAPPGVPDAKPP